MDFPQLVVHAHAKINLGLEVLGRRDDGLHEVATVLQTISVADRLVFTPGDALTLHCRGMRATPDNLILRAARLLQMRTATRQRCAIICQKRIPLAAGLGGGSADAGATLRALNRLWDCQLSAPQLADLAGELGADVPFAICGGTALATGTGRTLRQLPDLPSSWLVLVPLSAPAGDKTREMYGSLRPDDFTAGSMTRAQVAAIAASTLDPAGLRNAFQRPAEETWPETHQAIRALKDTEAHAIALTGAGPSVYALYGSWRAAVAGSSQVRHQGLPARVARFVRSKC